MASVRQLILEQVRRDGDDLAAIKSQLDRIEDKLDGLGAKLDAPDEESDGLAGNLDAFLAHLPEIVLDVVREVFRERDEEQAAASLRGNSDDK